MEGGSMYNFLMIADGEEKDWVENEGKEYKIIRRIFEYTEEGIKEKYKNNLDKLKNFPCLFTYEIPYRSTKVKTKGHIGHIISIKERSYYIIIKYRLDHTYPEFYMNKKNISDLEDLGITDGPDELGELNRTHWAIKNKNLFEFVAKFLVKKFNIESTLSYNEMKRIWGENYMNKPLVFLSHKAKYKKQVSQIKKHLKKEDINCFIAHEDIEPTLEWQKEIIKALNTMHIFIGIVTDDFHGGVWTDQEVGYAYKRKIPRILVKLGGVPPQGFISPEQAVVDANWNNINEKIMEQIKKTIKN